jgi:aryl-alcohol dehydrogenase-like predicted oxidoreductase
MLQRDIEKDVLPFCKEHNVGVVTYGSICRGLLTGKFKKGDTFPKNDLRSRDPMFNENFEKNLAIVEKLRPLAEKYDKTLAQLAINWVINRPGVTVAICGARRASQVESNAGGADWRISDEDLAEIEKIVS